MSKEQFKIGQVVSYKSATSTKRARKGGTITGVETMYELKDDNKRYYPNGVCRGELTTIKELSKGEPKGYAYRTNSIQPVGYTMDITIIEETNLRLSTTKSILDSYNV
tara:strand:- start:1128 stop:1451 length:324 start_codon:yes stop_codon:yes gene_type:complete